MGRYNRFFQAGLILLCSVAVLGSSPRAQGRSGPSFSCTLGAVQSQPLAQIVCSNDMLADLELSYVIAYQAMRHVADDVGKHSLARDASALVERATSTCKIPATGRTAGSVGSTTIDCLKEQFESARQQLISRLRGEALAEAQLSPSEAKEIQQKLKDKWFLEQDAMVDGVFGPATRRAIQQWQRSAGIRETGFVSRELSLASTDGALPSANANSTITAPTGPPLISRAVAPSSFAVRVPRVGPSYECSAMQQSNNGLRRSICENDELARLQFLLATIYTRMASVLSSKEQEAFTLAQSEHRILAECGMSPAPIRPNTVQCIARVLARDIKSAEQWYQTKERQIRARLDSVTGALDNAKLRAAQHARNGIGQLLRLEQQQIQRLQQERLALGTQLTALNDSWQEIINALAPVQSHWDKYQRQLVEDKEKAVQEAVRLRAIEAARLKAIEEEAAHARQAEASRMQALAEEKKREFDKKLELTRQVYLREIVEPNRIVGESDVQTVYILATGNRDLETCYIGKDPQSTDDRLLLAQSLNEDMQARAAEPLLANLGQAKAFSSTRDLVERIKVSGCSIVLGTANEVKAALDTAKVAKPADATILALRMTDTEIAFRIRPLRAALNAKRQNDEVQRRAVAVIGAQKVVDCALGLPALLPFVKGQADPESYRRFSAAATIYVRLSTSISDQERRTLKFNRFSAASDLTTLSEVGLECIADKGARELFDEEASRPTVDVPRTPQRNDTRSCFVDCTSSYQSCMKGSGASCKPSLDICQSACSRENRCAQLRLANPAYARQQGCGP